MRLRAIVAVLTACLLLLPLPIAAVATPGAPVEARDAAFVSPAVSVMIGDAAPEARDEAREAAPWWRTTPRDGNRDGLVDWLEAQRAPLPVGLSYTRPVTAADRAALAVLGHPKPLVLSTIDAVVLGPVEPTQLRRLAALPGVVLVEPLGRVVLYGDVQTPAIKARNSSTYPVGAWELGVTGHGVNIAVVDTGIDDGHPGLAGKFVAGYDAMCTDDLACMLTVGSGSGNYGELRQEDDGSFNPDDKHMHGTGCTGMATSTGADPNSPDPDGIYMGAAPDARLVDVRIGSALGGGPFENSILEQEFYESAMNGLEWTIDHRDEPWPGAPPENYGIDIISLSWGIISHEEGGSDGTEMHSRMLDAATEAGIVVSVAIGNDGPDNDGLSGMGASSLSVTVAALDDHNTIPRDDDTIAGYSSRGPRRDNGDDDPYDELKPDVAAPGSNIVQAEACTGTCQGDAGHLSYSGRGSGTSYATPSVAGTMALMLEANGNLTPALVKEILRLTAEPRDPPTYPELDPFWNRETGWGMMDALAAVAMTQALTDPAGIDVALQARFTEVEANDTPAFGGLAWARQGQVTQAEYRLDGGAWRSVEYDTPLPVATGAYANWTLPDIAPELRYTGNHTVEVRSLGAGRASLSDSVVFWAAAAPDDEDDDDLRVPLLAAAAVVIGVAVAATVWNRFGR